MKTQTRPSALTFVTSATLLLLAAGSAAAQAPPTSAAEETQMPLVFSGGHETEGQDRGRPVILIAGALGVPPQVFREAFRQVRPAPAGREPEPQQVRANKAALLSALRRYGVTNERLDTVSNYYRYVPGRGNLWPVRPAAGYAVVRRGTVVRYVITEGGSGYSSPPQVTVPGLPGVAGTAAVVYGPTFRTNGSVSGVTGSAPPSGSAAPRTLP